MNDRPESYIEKAEAKEDICFEYGVFGLDAVDCDILCGLETEEKRNEYLKKRFLFSKSCCFESQKISESEIL